MSIRTLQPWIDAYTDLQADIQTFSFLMTLADLTSDSDYKLILADLGNGSTLVKLKVYRGTLLAAEIPLLEAPTAVTSLYTDNNEPRIPGVAVVCSSNVLVYRNCRPYFKFSLPALDCSSLEADIWRQKSQPAQLVRLLEELSTEVGYSNLSAPSQTLLALEPSAREEFAYKHRNCSIKKETTVTCVTTLKKSASDDKSVECIVLATESSQLFILDPEIFSVAESFSLSFVATLISTCGLYVVDYQVLMISRTGCVYTQHSGVCHPIIQLSALPVCLVQQPQSFISANMDNTLQCFSTKGIKQWSLTLPGAPVTMAFVPVTSQALNLVALALNLESGGCVQLYSGPQLMHSFITSDPISSLMFGRYGQEEHALVSVSNGGALSVKLLKRTANFGNGEKPMTLQNQPHNIKLLVPKKSKLFVEQTLREREQCKDMHAWFHRTWLGLSLKASEAYLNALNSSTVCQKEALKLTAHVLGLGPKLKINLFLENLAVDYVPAGLAVTFVYDTKVYTLHKPYIPVPMLVPGLTCCLETLVTCELAVVSPVTVLVFANRIILSASINMPPGFVRRCYKVLGLDFFLFIPGDFRSMTLKCMYLSGLNEHNSMPGIGNRDSTLGDVRIITLNTNNKQINFPENKVKSYKYTKWNFLLKNMYEQFRRIANFYFLCMTIISFIVESSVSPLVSLVPLIFVVTVTAIKQGYEDILRHRADNKVNCGKVTVVRNGCAEEIECKKIRVGDIVRVRNNNDIPCDIVLLISSTNDSKCYVTTANLDGETNLKTLECPLECDLQPEHLAKLCGVITCEQPTMDLYQFHGNIKITIFTNNSESFDDSFNPAFVETEPGGHVELCGGSCRRKSTCSFKKIGIKTDIEYYAPLSSNNLLLRGSSLKNTEYVYGCAVYTGHETKLALNSTITKNKFSILERSINVFLLFFSLLLIAEVLISVTLQYYTVTRPNYAITMEYLGPRPDTTYLDLIKDSFTYFVLYYYVIPISLYITIELQRFLGTFFFEWDLEMYSKDQNAICNTSDLNEELGQVKYLFTDKTGTLTENDMCFRRCSINGVVYYENKGVLYKLPECGTTIKAQRVDTWTPELERFFIAMALCHSVQCYWNNNIAETDPNQLPEYHASSPDEKALVDAAARCGVIFLREEGNFITIDVKGKNKTFKKLQVLEFTSDRKRMSVIVRDETGSVLLFCKGAEVSMLPIVSSGPFEETITHYTDFAMRGLRTLVFAWKELDRIEYLRLARDVQRARGAIEIEMRDNLINIAYSHLESNLVLLGATAVEDKLQDKVPETLERLRAAGIKVWILTGDKVETALNIAHSCGHFKPGTIRLFLIDIVSANTCHQRLQDLKQQMFGDMMNQYGLVVDGKSLQLALAHDIATFQVIALACTAVVCCRLSPKQKAQLVHMVKESHELPITVAVGDGANDIAMIQEANVGLGIMGKEGRQAMRSSDFAFARFHFVARAILVHGHWYYLRAAILVQYFFYKNVVFITPQVFFTFCNGFSPQAFYPSVALMMYNTIFTAVPIIVYGLFEQNFKAETLLAKPYLYCIHRNNSLMSWKYFFQWVVVGFWDSAIVYWVPATMLYVNPIILSDDSPVEMMAFGLTVLHNIMVVVNIKLLLHSSFWSVIFLLTLVSSQLFFMLFILAYNFIPIVSTANSLFTIYSTLLLSPSFWLLSFLIMVMSIIPDVLFQLYTNTSWRKFFKMSTKNCCFRFRKKSVYTVSR